MNRKRKPDSSRESGDEEEACPEWLSKLLKEEDFSKECQQHSPSKINCFCLDCCIPICFHCNPTHKLHKSMQIYKYCKMNSVKLEVLDQFFDCDGIKEYKHYNKNLVLITSSKTDCKIEVSQYYVNWCRKNLRGGIYCSLRCKVDFCKSSIKDLIKYWGSNRGGTIETSAANQNAISDEASGSRTDAPNSNASLNEVSGSGTTAPEPNVTSNEVSGSRTITLDLNKTPSPDED